ncbi:hypothetical protein FH972_016638 [Carpinus fangiana]|uniref:4Fe-4S ferredoxin-type domain-containing protein n=1 Tax=Carpinus fangiana TaxID=176857 RepID=A0A5N6RIJ3_9ROSI|nr:hypothetical protein FH972_016638 [Carpinus fangiana]
MWKQAELMRRLGDGEEGGYDAVVVGSGYGGSVAACRMSMAGIKIVSAVRMENRNLGVSFGPKDALFQVTFSLLWPVVFELNHKHEQKVHEQNDSLAAVACGLGGGSLVNAGVMVPTPVRARRNPKWPKGWERDWENCEASAAAMLRIPSVPVKFPVAKVMGEILADGQIENSFETPLQLSMNFGLEEPASNLMKPQRVDSCLACGNCLAGCPYNAKRSHIIIEYEVQNVVKNSYEICEEGGIIGRKKRWHVYLNEIDCITIDFVVLSGGVLGTTEILFRSQMRGLKLSDALGSGFSCNGNTVAYLAGSLEAKHPWVLTE